MTRKHFTPFVVSAFVLLAMSVAQGQSAPRLTDNMTPDEFRKCGLQKLSSAELEALNQWMLKTLVANLTEPSQDSSDDEIALYESDGTPVAYIAVSEDSTIYTWSGKPVAYLDGDNIYGFNGKHLGWFQDGKLYDHQGKIAGATAKVAVAPPKPERVKAVKQIKPIKSIASLAPIQPLHSLSWSQLPLLVLLSQGAR